MNPGFVPSPEILSLLPVVPNLIPDELSTVRDQLQPERVELRVAAGLSLQELRNYAGAFNNAASKYHSKSPFIKEKNFLEKIWHFFVNVIKFLFDRIKLTKLPDDLEIKFSMHLFRTLDDLPIKDSSLTEPLPFSFVLNSWSKVLQECHVDNPISKSLKHCADYQKELESIKSSRWFRNKRLSYVKKRIIQDIDKLKTNETLLLPGGFNPFISKNMLAAKFISNSIKNPNTKKQLENLLKNFSKIPMLYEISKNEEGQIILRLCHDSMLFHMALDIVKDETDTSVILSELGNFLKKPENIQQTFSQKELFTLGLDNLENVSNILKFGEGGKLNFSPGNLKGLLDAGFRGSPMREFKITTHLLKDKLDDLLYANVFDHKFDSLSFLGKFFYGANLALEPFQGGIERLMRGSSNQILRDGVSESTVTLANDMSAIKVLKVFSEFRKKTQELSQGNLPRLSKQKVKLRLRPDSEKTIEVFTKTQNIKTHKLNKLLMKTVIFFDMYHKSKAHLGNPKWRKWIKECAHSLLKSVENQFVHNNILIPELGPDSAFIKEINAIIESIELRELEDKFELPPGPKLQKRLKLSFNEEPLVCDRKTTKMSSFKKVNVRAQKQHSKEVFNAAELNFQTFNFELAQKKLLDMGKRRKFDLLDRSVNDIFSMLQKVDREQKWDGMSAQTRIKWSNFLLDIFLHRFQTHFSRGHSGARPHEIQQLLFGLEIVQKLCHLNEDINHFQGFHIDTKPYREMINDAYLNLGSHAYEILRSLDQIDKAPGFKVILGSATTQSRFWKSLRTNNDDERFFLHYMQKKGVVVTPHEEMLHFEDFGKNNRLSEQLIHLRKMNIIAHILMARHRTVHQHGFFNRAGHFFHSVVDTQTPNRDNERTNTSADAYAYRVRQDIDRRLYAMQKPIFEVNSHIDVPLYPESTHIGSKLYFHDYSDLGWLSIPFGNSKNILERQPSIYEDTGEDVPTTSIRNRLFDGNIVSQTQPSWYIPRLEINWEQNKGRGKDQTERSILDHKEFKFPGLPFDVSAELQLIQTSPEKTRIQNTIGCLVRHNRLLNDPNHGYEFQRFFTTNLFRNGRLHQHLLADPSYSSILVKEMRRLFSILSISNHYSGAIRIMQITECIHQTLEKVLPLCQENQDLLTQNLKQFAEMVEKNKEVLHSWCKKSATDPLFIPYRRIIHHSYLLHHATRLMTEFYSNDLERLKLDEEINNNLFNILYSHVMKLRIPVSEKELNPYQDELIEYLWEHVDPLIKKQLDNQKARDQWLWNLVPVEMLPPEAERGSWKADTEHPIYVCGNMRLDLRTGKFYHKGIALCPFPVEITHSKTCQKLFGDVSFLEKQAKHWGIEYNGNEGGMYEFQGVDGKQYRIAQFSGQIPLIYRKIGKSWYQYHNLEKLPHGDADKLTLEKTDPILMKTRKELLECAKAIPTRTTPYNFSNHLVWVKDNGKDFFVENRSGKPIYKGILSWGVKADRFPGISAYTRSRLIPIKMIKEINSSGDSVPIFNPWEDQRFSRFLALDSANNIEATGSYGLERILYTKLGLEFRWNSINSCWDCETYKGYRLSDKKAHQLMPNNESLFSISFNNYFVLEHDTKPPMILLSGEPFKKSTIAGSDSRLSKNLQKSVEPSRSNESLQTSLYTFTLDRTQQRLMTSNLVGYRYLAYQLFIQGKYQNALSYLRLSQGLAAEKSAEIDKWFEEWDTTSPTAKVLVLHLQLMNLEQQLLRGAQNVNRTQIGNLVQKIAGYYAIYKVAKIKKVIPASLHLREREELNFLATIGNYSNFLNNLANTIPDPEARANLQNLLNEVVNELNQQNLEMDYLDRIIAENAAKLQLRNLNQKLTERDFKGIPIFTGLEEFVKPAVKVENGAVEANTQAMSTEDQERAASLEKKTDEFITAFKEALRTNGGIEETAQMMEADINYARLQNVSSAKLICPKTALPTLRKKLEIEKELLSEEVLLFRKEIEKFYPKESIELNELKKYSQRLEKPDNSQEKFFQDFLFCYGAEDWKNCAWLKAEDSLKLEGLLQKFLISATRLQQYEKAVILLYEVGENPTETQETQLVQLLAQERQYNPETYAYRRSLLPLEYNSQIIVRENQRANIELMLDKENKNLVTHQGMNEGKTTVTRQAISKEKADGVSCAGVVTLETLIEMHNELLGKTSTQTWGDNVYRLEFKRGDPSHVFALQSVLRNIKKTIAFHGRVDTTEKCLLSLHHAFILKMEEIQKSNLDPEAENRIQDELDVLSDIFTELYTRAKLTTDEIDEVFNPEHEHVYAIRDQNNQLMDLDSDRTEAGLDMMRWILTSQWRNMFQLNQHYMMEEGEIRNFLTFIAKAIHQKYLKETDQKQAIEYLTGFNLGSSEAAIEAYFTTHIDKHKHRNRIVAFYKFLRFVLPGAGSLDGGTFKRRGGVDFMRSEDGILVKPCKKPGKCAENSQRGTEEEIIWYTILNYMDLTLGGVTKDQIAQIINDKKSKASKNVLASQRENPNGVPVKFEDTEQAKTFKKHFGKFNLELQTVTSSDYATVVKEINSQSDLLSDFLKHQVFSQVKMSPEKIPGNPTDVAELLNELSGSSGTNSNFRTLPDKINKDTEHARQKGSDGKVLLALIKDYLDDDIIAYDDTKDPVDEIAPLLKPGSALIDLDPAFPGISPLEIARKFSAKIPGITIRFFDSDDKVKVIDGPNATPKLAERDLDLTKIITIFDFDHCRGVDEALAVGIDCFATVGYKTRYSRALQGFMRARKLGKGQKIRPLVNKGLYTKLGDEPRKKLPNLIARLSDCEEKSLQYVHYKAEKQKISGVPKTRLFRGLYTIGNKEKRGVNGENKERIRKLRKDLWKKKDDPNSVNIRDYFIQPTREDLSKLGRPQRTEKAAVALKEIKQHEVEKLNTLLRDPLIHGDETLRQITVDALDFIGKRKQIDEKYLPSTVYRFQEDQEQAQDIEKEQEQEQAQEQEQEQEQAQEIENANDNSIDTTEYKSLKLDNLAKLLEGLKAVQPALNHPVGFIYDPLIASNFRSLHEDVKFYDPSVIVTRNFLHFERDHNPHKPWGAQKSNEALPARQNRAQRFILLVDKKENKVYALMGSLKDLDYDLHRLDKEKNGDIDYYIYNLYRDDLDGRKINWNLYSDAVRQQIVRLMVQVKMFNGEIDLIRPENPENDPLRNEFEMFNKWLQEIAKHEHPQNGIKRLEFINTLERNLKKYLKHWRPSQLEDYPHSTMCKAFRSAKKQVNATELQR